MKQNLLKVVSGRNSRLWIAFHPLIFTRIFAFCK